MAIQYAWMWTEAQHKKWPALRRKGRWRYILSKGVLGWGGAMFLIMCVCQVVFGFPQPPASTLSDWTWNVVSWFAVDILYVAFAWTWSEKLYDRTEAKRL